MGARSRPVPPIPFCKLFRERLDERVSVADKASNDGDTVTPFSKATSDNQYRYFLFMVEYVMEQLGICLRGTDSDPQLVWKESGQAGDPARVLSAELTEASGKLVQGFLEHAAKIERKSKAVVAGYLTALRHAYKIGNQAGITNFDGSTLRHPLSIEKTKRVIGRSWLQAFEEYRTTAGVSDQTYIGVFHDYVVNRAAPSRVKSNLPADAEAQVFLNVTSQSETVLDPSLQTSTAHGLLFFSTRGLVRSYFRSLGARDWTHCTSAVRKFVLFLKAKNYISVDADDIPSPPEFSAYWKKRHPLFELFLKARYQGESIKSMRLHLSRVVPLLKREIGETWNVFDDDEALDLLRFAKSQTERDAAKDCEVFADTGTALLCDTPNLLLDALYEELAVSKSSRSTINLFRSFVTWCASEMGYSRYELQRYEMSETHRQKWGVEQLPKKRPTSRGSAVQQFSKGHADTRSFDCRARDRLLPVFEKFLVENVSSEELREARSGLSLLEDAILCQLQAKGALAEDRACSFLDSHRETRDTSAFQSNEEFSGSAHGLLFLNPGAAFDLYFVGPRRVNSDQLITRFFTWMENSFKAFEFTPPT